MIAPPAINNTQSEGDSDSDWDDDDDFGAKKINIKIKPVAQVTPSKISASVDELRATVGTWKSLANINLVKPNSRRHHQSTAQLNTNGVQERPVSMMAPSALSAIIPPKETVPALDKAYSTIFNSEYNAENSQRSSGSVYHNGTTRSTIDQQILGTDELYSRRVAQDIDRYDYLYGILPADSFIKSNGFLQPTTSSILKPEAAISDGPTTSSNVLHRLPVALAIQETLNVTLQKGTPTRGYAYVSGSIKMAVPPKIINMSTTNLEEELKLILSSSSQIKIRLDSDYVRESMNPHSIEPLVDSNITRQLAVDMKAVQNYARSLYQKQPNNRYFVSPELVRYTVGSQDMEEHEDVCASLNVNPLHASAHWLCDLNITKVRVDIQFLDATLRKLGLTTDDITGLKISMHVNGGVISYQSKPDANWNPLNSKLTWSFTSLSEFVCKSTQNGVTSCLARFDLNDGPSTSSDVNLQFSIVGKSIGGALLSLGDVKSYYVVKQKYEVRTGTFKCQSPCH